MLTKISTKASIWPRKVRSRFSRIVIILVVDECNKLVSSLLRICFQVSMLNKPFTNCRISPTSPDGVLGVRVIISNKCLKFLALQLGVGLDDVVLD